MHVPEVIRVPLSALVATGLCAGLVTGRSDWPILFGLFLVAFALGAGLGHIRWYARAVGAIPPFARYAAVCIAGAAIAAYVVPATFASANDSLHPLIFSLAGGMLVASLFFPATRRLAAASLAIVVALVPTLALADNCSGLGDCFSNAEWGAIAAAAVVAAAAGGFVFSSAAAGAAAEAAGAAIEGGEVAEAAAGAVEAGEAAGGGAEVAAGAGEAEAAGAEAEAAGAEAEAAGAEAEAGAAEAEAAGAEAEAAGAEAEAAGAEAEAGAAEAEAAGAEAEAAGAEAEAAGAEGAGAEAEAAGAEAPGAGGVTAPTDGGPLSDTNFPNFNEVGGNQNCADIAQKVDQYLGNGTFEAGENTFPGPNTLNNLANNTGSSWDWATSYGDINRGLLDAGDGARGIVYVGDEAGAHVFNVVNNGGTIIAIDGQTGIFGSISGVAAADGYGAGSVVGFLPTFGF